MYWPLIFQLSKILRAANLSVDSDVDAIGVHIDTGRLVPVWQRVAREQRFCLVCDSESVTLTLQKTGIILC